MNIGDIVRFSDEFLDSTSDVSDVLADELAEAEEEGNHKKFARIEEWLTDRKPLIVTEVSSEYDEPMFGLALNDKRRTALYGLHPESHLQLLHSAL